jgi:hypothetical protein
MNNTILIQQIYPDTEGVKLLELTRQRHRDYCIRWQMDFQCLTSASSPKFSDPKPGSWSKVELMKFALEKGYSNIIWLDADTLIKDLDTDLRDGCVTGIGTCWQRIPQLNHWNVGAVYLTNSKPVHEFIDAWMAGYPGINDGWMEQGVFNRLAMQSKVVQTISDRWNATLNHTMVPDAVVLGFHGYGTTQERYEAMQVTLKSLEAREGME